MGVFWRAMVIALLLGVLSGCASFVEDRSPAASPATNGPAERTPCYAEDAARCPEGL